MSEEKPGATGQFPDGQLDSSDEGQLNMSISRVGDKVRVDFGKPVAWLAMTPAQAVGLAMLLQRHAAARPGR